MAKNLTLVLFLIFIAFNVKANDDSYHLSRDASFELNKIDDFTDHILPATKAIIFLNKKEKVSFYVSRQKPDYMANQSYVARQWNQLTKKSKDNITLPEDCKKINPLRFECSRMIKHSEREFELQTFYWNSIKDTVYVQLKAESEYKIKQWKKKFNVTFNQGHSS